MIKDIYGYEEARIMYPNSQGETLDEVIAKLKARGRIVDEAAFRCGWAEARRNWVETAKDIGPLTQEQGHDGGD